jgi:HAD superfamily hydrolase (TIGR01484 family)
MTYSVVATDLDGTIVRRDGTISPRTRAALAAVQRAGTLLVVVTGRPPRWLGGIADATGSGLAICANGALVYDLEADAVVEATPIEPAALVEVFRRLRAGIPDLHFAVECVNGQFVREPGYTPRWTPDSALVLDDLMAEIDVPVAKVLGRREGMGSDELLASARDAIGDHLVSLTHSSIDGLLEINGYGVTKATTLERLVAARGFGAPDVIAFGDMPNDLEMLEWAGHAVAVANAHRDVLAVVDEITASNEDDGVAVVLERLYRSNVASRELG